MTWVQADKKVIYMKLEEIDFEGMLEKSGIKNIFIESLIKNGMDPQEANSLLDEATKRALGEANTISKSFVKEAINRTVE